MNNILVSSLGFLCLIYPRLAVEHAGKQKIPSCWPKSRIATKAALSKESWRLAKQCRKRWASVRTFQPDITEQNCGLALPIPAKSISGALSLPLLDSAIVKAVVRWYQKGKTGARPLSLQTRSESPFPHIISRDNEEPQSPPPVVLMWYSPCHTGAKESSRNRSIKQQSKSNVNMRNPNCN